MFSFMIAGETKVILNEGMPQFKNIDNRGRLIVEFKVQYMHAHLCMLCLVFYAKVLSIYIA